MSKWFCGIGWFLATGAAMLFARLIWEETFLTWQLGPQMVGFSLAHDYGAVLFLFPPLLLLWTVIALVITIHGLVKKKRVSRKRWMSLGAIAALIVTGSLPEGFWQTAFAGQMAKSPASADLLTYAAARSEVRTVRALLDHGVPVNAKDNYYWKTALHGAAARGNVELIQLLLSRGAAMNALDRAGDSPLEIAMSSHQDAAAKMLAAAGAIRTRGSDQQREQAIRDEVSETMKHTGR